MPIGQPARRRQPGTADRRARRHRGNPDFDGNGKQCWDRKPDRQTQIVCNLGTLSRRASEHLPLVLSYANAQRISFAATVMSTTGEFRLANNTVKVNARVRR